MITVKEPHDALEQTTLYQIETIPEGTVPVWEILCPGSVKVGGKFVSYHADFRKFVRNDDRVFNQHGFNYVDSFTFTNDKVATDLAKALSQVWDRPLRVMKVQRIRIQKQTGKIILPVGGV